MSLSRLQIPYMTTAQRVAIVPLDRDLVFDTDLRRIFVGNGSTMGGLSLSTDGLGMTWHGTYSGGHTYNINDIVPYNGSTYICILESNGNVPTNGTYWNVLAQGIDITNFMDKATYDPTSVGGDAFDMDNMVEGTNNKLVSATDKSNFHAPGSDNQDLSGLMVKASNLSDVVNVTTARNNILPSKTSNALKVLRVNSGETDYELVTMAGGNVVGPASSTDSAVARFDLTTGRVLKDSAVIIADTTGDITGGKYNTVAISGSSTPALSVSGTASISGSNTGDNSPNTSIAATKLDDFTTPDDNTDLNANTTNHGLLLKATQPASTFINVVAIGNGETVYSNKALFDSTAPSTQAFGDSAATGSAVIAARRDHKHAMPVAPSGGTPALVLGTTATAGSSSNFLRVDDTIVAFDATAPSTQAFGDSAVVGSATVAAHRDHKHAMPTNPSDASISVTDVTTNNASTSMHGFAPKAVAPAANVLNVVGIANGETVYTDKSIFDATAPTTQAFGDAASSGTSLIAAHRDHKHAMPTNPSDASISVTDVTTNNASTSMHGFAPKAVAPAANTLNVLGIANGETTIANKLILDASTTPSTQAYGDTATIGTSLVAAHADHKHAMPKSQNTPTAIWGDCVQSSSVVAGTVCYVRVPYSGTISSWYLIADVATTATMDVWKLNAALPTVGNTITAAAKPALTTATTATATTAGWSNTTVVVGDVFGFRLDTLTSGAPTSITLVLNVG